MTLASFSVSGFRFCTTASSPRGTHDSLEMKANEPERGSVQTSLNENPLTDCMLCCRFAKRKTNADSPERGLACLHHLGQLTSKKSAALSSRDLIQPDGIVAISPWCRMLRHFGFIHHSNTRPRLQRYRAGYLLFLALRIITLGCQIE